MGRETKWINVLKAAGKSVGRESRSVEDAQSVVRSNRGNLDTAILMTLVLVLDYTTLLVFGVQ